jgi:hypothetical protein
MQLTTTPGEPPHARLALGQKDGIHLFTLRVGDRGPRRVCTVARVRRMTSRTASSATGPRITASLNAKHRSRNGSG